MRIRETEILLIEDNPYEAELAIRNFKKSGLANRLIHIDDGERAIEYIFSLGSDKSRHPRLILLDLKLPKISGHEILETIRNNETTRNIPVVILTSSNQEPDILKSYDLGANSYIVKPVDFEHFSEVISNLGLYWIVFNQQPSEDW